MLGEGLRAGLAHMGIPHRTVCYVEREAHAAAVLAARIQEGSLDAAPVWSDLLTFDAAAWRGKVDCVVAGFPCQDLSLAGRRAGLDGARSGLFFNVVDIADACGAWSLFLENVAGIASATATVVDEAAGELEERAAARVLGELADRGWHAEWITLSASDVGASHGRARWFCWAWRMGHPGLQHQQLQQWPDGAEHPGASQPMADAECAERRPQCFPRAGGIQGDDSGRGKEDDWLGVANAVLGDTDHERTHWAGPRPEQDRCCEPSHASGCLADATGHGRDTWRSEPSRKQGRPHAAECGGAVADPRCQCNGAHEPQSVSGRSHPANDCAGCSPMAHTSSTGRQGHQLGTACDCDGGGEEAHGPASQLCGVFAPGPSDPRWAGILVERPYLAPALEPTFRGVVNGLAFDMGDSRAARLKCVGNGVVPLCAAVAFVTLVRRVNA